MVRGPVNKKVPQDMEPREFRPVPGFEEDWAGFRYVQRSRLWDAAGTYPIGLWFVLVLLMIGVASCG